MTRTQRLQPVVQHTDKKQQKALQEVAKSQAALITEQSRLGQLKSYKTEYLYSNNQPAETCSSMGLQELHRFLQQLDDTIARQQDVIKLRERELEQKRELWKGTRIDSKMMNKVVDNLQQQEIAEHERKEQKSMDEFSQRISKSQPLT